MGKGEEQGAGTYSVLCSIGVGTVAWLGHSQVNFPSQILGQQGFAILLFWSIHLQEGRNQVFTGL